MLDDDEIKAQVALLAAGPIVDPVRVCGWQEGEHGVKHVPGREIAPRYVRADGGKRLPSQAKPGHYFETGDPVPRGR